MRLIGAPSVCGLGDDSPPPWQFRFPGAKESSLGLASGLHALYTGDQSAVLRLVPPAQASASALRGAVESTVGSSLGSIVSQGLPADAAINVRAMAAALVDDAVDLAIDAATSAAADAVGEAIEVIPVLGKLVSAIYGLVSSILQMPALREAELERKLDQRLDKYCRDVRNGHTVVPTSSTGPTPADQFRQVAYSYQLGKPLPANVGSLYVLLCGTESEGLGFETRRQYELWLKNYAPLPLLDYGIEASVQRKMWALIKGIMESVQDPSEGALPTATDQGRALMPLLQELVRQQRLAGRIPDSYLLALSDFVARRYTQTVYDYGYAGQAGGTMSATGNCASPRRIQLVGHFVAANRQWENTVETQYYDAVKQRWTLTPAGMWLRAQGTRGLLMVDSTSSAQIAKDVEKALEPEPPFSPIGGLAIGTGMLGMGYGAWTLMRRFGPKRR